MKTLEYLLMTIKKENIDITIEETASKTLNIHLRLSLLNQYKILNKETNG